MTEQFDLFYQTTGACTDTRKIEKDCLFICLKGDNFNGNTFAEQALLNGAMYAIVDEEEFKTNDRIVLVKNTLKYLQDLAHYHRLKFNIPIIGITGSNGKTSTKEIMNAVLSQKYSVLATEGNLNNHIGVPLTLLRIKKHHEIAIIEMGANRFKDIEELCAIAKPTHGIITNIGKAHLEGFGDFKGVLKTKKELFDSISHDSGTIIYNEDDQTLSQILPSNVSTFSYGTTSKSEIQGSLLDLTPFVELSWSFKDYNSPALQTKMIGKYNFYNYLSAIAFGVRFQVPFELINKAITAYKPENNRSQVKETSQNTLILDCYNANPSSMRSALESFAMIIHPNKTFIIGDMLELGEDTELEHSLICQLTTDLGLSGYSVGPIFHNIVCESFKYQFSDKTEAMNYFKQNPLSNSLILLKGSRGIGLETLENSL